MLFSFSQPQLKATSHPRAIPPCCHSKPPVKRIPVAPMGHLVHCLAPTWRCGASGNVPQTQVCFGCVMCEQCKRKLTLSNAQEPFLPSCSSTLGILKNIRAAILGQVTGPSSSRSCLTPGGQNTLPGPSHRSTPYHWSGQPRSADLSPQYQLLTWNTLVSHNGRTWMLGKEYLCRACAD